MIGCGGFAVEAELPVPTVAEREEQPVVRHQRRVAVSATHKGELSFGTFDRYDRRYAPQRNFIARFLIKRL